MFQSAVAHELISNETLREAPRQCGEFQSAVAHELISNYTAEEIAGAMFVVSKRCRA